MNSIQKHREQAGVSQEQLGNRCGWGNKSQSRISNYETGKRTPSLEDMRLIVSALNNSGVECSIDDLFPPRSESAA